MGGNDLNLKKSWHPQLMTNQRRVYEAERAALQERKLTEARLEEIRRERQIEETQKQLEAVGGPKRVDRVDWMYQGPNDGGRDEYSSEAFLLGKRRIDSILRGDDAKKVEKMPGPSADISAPLTAVPSARDVANKIREDPLVAIKRQEQEAYQTMMKDSRKRRQLLTQMGLSEDPIESKVTRHRNDRPLSHRKYRSHRYVDDEAGERRRRRDYSSNQPRSPRRNDDDTSYEHWRQRRRTDSRDKIGARRRSDSRDGGRNRRRHDSDFERADIQRRRDSPERRRNGCEEENRPRRGVSDDRLGIGGEMDSSHGQHKRGFDDRRRNGYNRGGDWARRDYPDRRPRPASIDEEERARKLAAMQNDAMDLDQAREERLAALAKRERASREADDRARISARKYGGREFASNLYNAARNESLVDRIGRGRQGLQRDRD